ncbi:SDR family oxidoreductase [Microtetraspora sp. AC03309]|nr:SDR family oxidoreductase [Microtetraspora sp. AC03309]
MEGERGLECGTRRLPGADIDGLLADGFRQEGDELLLAAADEVFLGAEVTEEGALGDTGLAGDLRDGRLVVPLLREQAQRAGEGLGAAMTAAKGALLPLVRSLAIELAPRRIRVNAVSPGLINTPAYSKMGISPDTIASWGDGVPLGRVGAPADIAEAVAFLASDGASYITGDNLIVSGGIGVHTRPV